MVICAHGPAVKLAAGGLDPQDAAGAYFLFYFILFNLNLPLVVLTHKMRSAPFQKNQYSNQ
jgi:hypothetical protein